MACSKNLRTDLLVDADTGGTWTYNGAIFITGSANPYDGDEDNVAQFSGSADVIASPPGELPAAGNPVAGGDDPNVDWDGHTSAYYSFTYTVLCAATPYTENVVLPVYPQADAGNSTTIEKCKSDVTFNLYTTWGVDAPPNAATSGGYWTSGSGLSYLGAGYSNFGTTVITDDTLDPTVIPVGSYTFNYYEKINTGSYNSSGCVDCVDTSTLIVEVKPNPSLGIASSFIYNNCTSLPITASFNIYDKHVSYPGQTPVSIEGTWSIVSVPYPAFPITVDGVAGTYDSGDPLTTLASDYNIPIVIAEPGEVVFQYTKTVGGCTDTVTMTIDIDFCCPNVNNCYTAEVADGDSVYGFMFGDFSLLDATNPVNPNPWLTGLPYTLPGDNAALEADLQAYLDANGGGTVSITAMAPKNTIQIDLPCQEFFRVCTLNNCEAFVAFTSTVCL